MDHLHVSFRGKSLSLQGVDRATHLSALQEKLEELTTVPVANQKLIFKGKALHGDSDTLEAVGIFSPAGEGKILHKSRLMLVGSTASEVKVARSGPPGHERNVAVRNDLSGLAIPKGYKRVALNHQAGPSEFSPYRFQRVETLPGLPEEETARKILETLSDDPGVRAVLEKHRWTVGALCELYPEGKVGISDTCVMGLNQNHGMKILLRLRTDDLQGFRKMLSIRKVLFHELAHNDFSEHDDNFYMLMRQVEREAAELNWAQQAGGRTVAGRRPTPRAEGVGGGGGGGYVLVKEAFEGGSGRLGGDSDGLQHLFSARQLAGQAAVGRLTPEEQEVEDCCGHTSGNKDATLAATAATRTASSTEAMFSPRRSGDRLKPRIVALEAEGAPEEWGIRSRNEGLVADAAAVSTEEVATWPCNDDEREAETVTGTQGGSTPGVVTGRLRRLAGIAQDDAEMGDVVSAVGDGVIQEGSSTETRTRTYSEDTAKKTFPSAREQQLHDKSGSGKEISPASLVAGTVNMDVHEDDADETTSPSPAWQQGTSIAPPFPHSSSTPSHPPLHRRDQHTAPPVFNPLDELLAMGFPREEAVAALAATGGSIPDAAYRLLTPTVSSLGSSEPMGGGAVGAGDEPVVEGDGVHVTRLSRDVRLQKEAETIAGHGDIAVALQCLDVLIDVFRKLMEHPGEEKFRKIRRSNRKFKASVESVPGGVHVLLAAGFEERGPDHLELGRRDTGLIWLAKSTLEACRDRLEASRRSDDGH